MFSYRYRTKSESIIPVKYIEHYKKTYYEAPFQENLHMTLNKTKTNKRTIIYVFANGRRNQVPEKFVLTTEDLHNWYKTLNHIAQAIDMPEGICKYIFEIVFICFLIICVVSVQYPEIKCVVLLKFNMAAVTLQCLSGTNFANYLMWTYIII